MLLGESAYHFRVASDHKHFPARRVAQTISEGRRLVKIESLMDVPPACLMPGIQSGLMRLLTAVDI